MSNLKINMIRLEQMRKNIVVVTLSWIFLNCIRTLKTNLFQFDVDQLKSKKKLSFLCNYGIQNENYMIKIPSPKNKI